MSTDDEERLPPLGARSTVKIGPAKRHHTAGHHVIAKTDLRAGTVKARRPRARAGGAKRRALHGAEHRSSIDCVMVGASDVAQLVALMRAKRARSERGRRSVASSRATVQFVNQDFPHERDQMSGSDPLRALGRFTAFPAARIHDGHTAWRGPDSAGVA